MSSIARNKDRSIDVTRLVYTDPELSSDRSKRYTDFRDQTCAYATNSHMSLNVLEL